MQEVAVEYAVRDGASIAFEVFGAGAVDVVVSNNVFPIDLMWDLPQLADFMEALGEMARVIAYDPRGQGASDPLPTTEEAAGLESSAEDLLAVLDSAGCDRATFFDLSFGTKALFFAATYPDRVRSLVIAHLRTSFPELRGFTVEQRRKMARALATTRGLRSDNPRVAHDPALQRWWGRARRLANSPEGTARQMEWAAQTDLAPLLATVRAPTLVMHRRENRTWNLETSRAATQSLPNARFVELPGGEQEIYLGDTASALSEIERFLAEADVALADERPLATVLFTDIVASTEQLAAAGDREWRRALEYHDNAVDRAVTLYRGRVVKRLGDGILATFDGPARAVRCAAAILDSIGQQGMALRAGLHTGEIELRSGDVAGIAVHIASRISALAHPGEIVVSRTVVDLTGGSGITYHARGDHELKGIPGTWTLFSASVHPTARLR